jgi:PAS domain S-box-containing protein
MLVDIAHIRSALEDDALVPCFQPIVELHTGLLAGFEVLARWRHPHLGLVLPENFIPLADQNGLIGLLTQQIMRKAFLSASLIPDPLVLAVNVSPSQLRDMGLPLQIREAAAQAGFPLKRLTIEITETGLLDNLERAQQITRELKALGCRLSLDDFGTGYSSLSHLQALPFGELKVDRSFVSSMTNSRESRKIAATIIGLGRSLGLRTVAEGVETEEQAEMLLWLGCEFAQGWFYGKPMTTDRLPDAVAATPRKLTTRLSMHGDGWVVSSLEAQPSQRLAQLQAIYDGAPVGLCFLARNLRYVSLNRRLADMDGNSIAAYMGKTVQEMIPRAFPFFEPYLRRALRGESIPEVEVSVPSPIDGEADRTTLLSYQPAFDEAGEVIGVSLSAIDITARKRTEEALRESEEHLRNMVELNPEIPWVLDAEGNNIDVSSRWTRLTGLTKEQTRNLGWLDALHPDDVEPTMKALREGMRTIMPIDVEYRVKSLDQGWRWMRSRGSPRVGPTGKIVRWYGSVEDIHERKLMEEALHNGKQ